MKIIRESLVQGAEQAQGVTVIIDVFRAFTSLALFFYHGCRKVILVNDPKEALFLKSIYGDVVLSGEVDELPIPGFDLGNSPSEIMINRRGFLDGKVVVQRTSAGVKGVISAVRNADLVIPGSYVTAGAIARFILSQEPLPEIVTLVAMGTRGVVPSPEDEGCADYLEHLLSGTSYDHTDQLRRIVFDEAAQKFIRGNKVHLPVEDPLFCLQRDLFDFVLTAAEENGSVTVNRKELSSVHC